MGAPQYFEKDGDIGGAVYVYINKGGKWDQVKPTRIDGPIDSMFGLAVQNLGDINQDGFEGESCRGSPVNTSYCSHFICLHNL